MITRQEIIQKAWELYYSKEDIADYTKYDALYDVVSELEMHEDMSFDEYETLINLMEYI